MLRELVRMLIETLMPEIQVETASDLEGARGDATAAARFDLLLLLFADEEEALLGSQVPLALAGGLSGRPPIAVMAAHWTPRAAQELFRQGVRAIIPLPFPPDHLRAVMHLLLSGGAYRPATEAAPDPDHGAAGDSGHPMARAADPFAAFTLTQRQLQVLELMRQGHANKSIALRLGLRETTVKVHVKAILKRLNVRNRTQAALLANQLVRAD